MQCIFFKFFVIKPFSFTSVHSVPRNNCFKAMVDSIKRQFPEDVLLSSAKVLNVHCSCGQKMRVSGYYGDKEVAFLARLTGLNTVDVLIDFRDYN